MLLRNHESPVKTITMLTDRANLAAMNARFRFDSLTSDPELGCLAPADRYTLVAVVAFVVLVLAGAALIATKIGVLG